MQVLDTTTDELKEVPVDRAAMRAVTEATSIQDRISLALQSYGRREIYQSVADIAAKADVAGLSAYQALYRMAKKGELEILKEVGEHGREKVIGVKLNHAPAPIEVIEKAAAKAKREPHAIRRRMEPKVSATLIHLTKYMEKKLAIEKAKQILIEAGVSQDTVDQAISGMFTEDAIGEEAIVIYTELIETTKKLGEALVDNEAQRRSKEFVTE